MTWTIILTSPEGAEYRFTYASVAEAAEAMRAVPEGYAKRVAPAATPSLTVQLTA